MESWLNLSNPEFVRFLAVSALWVLPWKAFALWKAARLSHKAWFIVLFILNTFAILEIIYIFFVANRYKVESVEAPEPESDDKNNGIDMA